MGERVQDEAGSGVSGYQPMLPVLVAMSVGIAGDRNLPLGLLGWFMLAVALWWGWLLAWTANRQRVAALLLLSAVSCTAAAWHHVRWRCFALDELGLAASGESGPTCLEAIAATSPRLRPAPCVDPLCPFPRGDQTTLELRVTKVREGATWRAASGRVHLTVEGHLLDVRAGDRLRVLAALFSPRPPHNPGQFDFAAFQRSRRQLCGLHASDPHCIAVVQPGSNWHPGRWLNWLRDAGTALLARHLDSGRAELAAAVLLGARERVDRQQTEDFLATGTVHLLAISGLHVGILVWGLWWLKRLGLVSRRTALLAAIAFVIVYALITDARPPVIRAAILVSVMCSANLCGRQAFGMNALALAGVCLLMVNPTNLFQTGTQLSFLAVATLGSVGPLRTVLRGSEEPLDRLIAQSRPWPVRMARRAAQNLAGFWLASSSVWLVALPLVMFRFHVITPVAVVLNPLVLPLMAGALFSGFGVLMLGWLAPALAELSGSCCEWCLQGIEWGVETALSLRGNHAWTPRPPLWWVIGFYLALAIGQVWPRLRPSRRWVIALLCAWFALGLACARDWAPWRSHADRRPLICTFLAVGHGTSVIVELPGGQTILYDAGQLGSPASVARTIAASLWSRGRTHLDAVIVSHADVDHFNAVPALLRRFTVGVVYVSRPMLNDHAPAVQALREAARVHRVPLREIVWGDHLQIADGATLEVLHPPPQGVEGSDNASSIVLSIEYAGRTILLPGDLEERGLEGVIAELPLDCDVVMAPHHGSARSNPHGFAAWCTPEWVVVSGAHGDNAAVVQAYEAVGAVVLQTADVGAVQVSMDDDQLLVRSWLRPSQSRVSR